MPVDRRLTAGAHSFTTPSGATLTYFVRGRGSRVLVNVAPGWGCASVLYQNSLTFLERAFTFVHLEVRGTRGSSFPADPRHMSSWHMSEDVEALRVYLGLEAFEGLMGHSNGGCIATWFAIRFPDRVRTLVLVDSQLLGPEADRVRFPATKALVDARPERDAVDAFYNSPSPQDIPSDEALGKVLDSMLPLYFAYPPRHLVRFKREIFTNKPQVKPGAAQDRIEENFSNQDSQLGAIRARTLVLLGREDFICPVPVSMMLAADIPDSTLEILDNAGHFSWIEEPDRFERALKSFYGAA